MRTALFACMYYKHIHPVSLKNEKTDKAIKKSFRVISPHIVIYFTRKMLILAVILGFRIIATHGQFNDNFSRYKLWPMAAATFSTNPELCIKDTFANASVSVAYV